MYIRERLEAFWSGEKPDHIPYTIYHNEWKNNAADPAWEPMFKAGLGVTYHVQSVGQKMKNVEVVNDSFARDGVKIDRTIMRTPIGEIFMEAEYGWTKKHFLESEKDYKVMKYIVEHTDVFSCYEHFINKEKEIAPYGIALLYIGRTPIQTILVDYVGLENFSYHLFDFEDEMMELYEAVLKKFTREVELAAAGPGRFVSVLENFTAETMGPSRYEKFHFPVYNSLFPILQGSGKIVGTHYDGKLSSCSKLIAKAPIDLLESLTPPPEGDMLLSECRNAWPDKLFWSNINVSNYYLPKKELKDLVYDLIKQASPDGRKLAFEISEQYPDNWKESIPIVLETLNEIEI